MGPALWSCTATVTLLIGASTKQGSTGGSLMDFTYGRWASNLNDVFDWVAAQPWADRTRIGLWGISSGSGAALRFAAQWDKPRFVVSNATFMGFNTAMPNAPGRGLVEQWNKALR
jgi:dienelactone hydrolase